MARLIVEIEIPGTTADEIKKDKSWYYQDGNGKLDKTKVSLDEEYLHRDIFDENYFVFKLIDIKD